MDLFSLFWVVVAAFLIKKYVFDSGWHDLSSNRGKKKKERQIALLKAKAFLKPYKRLFGDFCLSNKNCSVSYFSRKMIFVIEKVADEEGKRRSFVANKFEVIAMDDFFNSLCNEFNYDTTYSHVLARCHCCTYSLQESYVNRNIKVSDIKDENEDKISRKINSEISTVNEEMIDVNSCSEAELVALPGVTIIMAKKIIQHREEKGSFASVEDFIVTMKIKPHFASQMRNLISANPVLRKKHVSNSRARIIDI